MYSTTDRTGTSGFSFNATTGVLTELAGSPFDTDSSYGSVVVDPSSQFVYVSDSENSHVLAFKRNLTDGSLSLIDRYDTEYGSTYGIAVTW